MTTELIARTGRVQSWLDNPESRLPVSCTVFVVEDSMEGPEGIEASWRFVSHALRNGAGVAVHLSKLRPAGSDNGRGLVASGPVSFGRIYSALNETLRRGGVYKNGAVVLHLDLCHDDILEFITTPRSELPWVKRCVDINPHWWGLASNEVRHALVEGIKKGDIWLNKTMVDHNGKRVYGNVCLEVYLPSRGTCLLQHVNLGACTINDLIPAFVQGMNQLCDLHGKTNIDESGEYLSSTIDRQVGLGMLGMANFLAYHNVSYHDFGVALQKHINGWDEPSPAGELARELAAAIWSAAQIARAYNMDRAFAIAPTASCSYRYTDLKGYTTAPEIAPPIARQVDRDSGTFGVQSFDYGPVEIASEVGWEDYTRVADSIMRLLRRTGLAHGYSFNSWSDVVTYNTQFIDKWMASDQTSLYYSLQVMDDTQDKTDVMAALDREADALLEELFYESSPIECDCQE